MTPVPLVGNDIVDLRHPRCQEKAEDERFLARVLAPGEGRAVRRAADAHRSLWIHWAAKEAAYKVVSKLRSRRPDFGHRRFAVSGEACAPACAPECGCVRELRLTVHHEDLRLPVRVTLTHEYVHGVAALSRAGGVPPEEAMDAIVSEVTRLSAEDRARWARPHALARHFTAAEIAAIRGADGAAARALARAAMARRLGIDAARIQIVRALENEAFSPPCVLVSGAPADVDLSLSHHGRYVAWAFACGASWPDPSAET